MEEAHVQADDVVKGIGWRIDSYLEEHEKSVELLARLDDIQNVFLSKNPRALEIANFALDKFYDALDIEVCYLMDSGGTVIASSNRSAADSIVGQNYSIRRYFLDAVQGVPSIYMAVGIISKKPGIYYSYPVYGHDGKTPAGVAVIRSSVKHIEEIINEQFDGAMSVVDPNGVVFISNRKDWLYGTLWRLPDEQMSEITKILQLGDEQLEWTGLRRTGENYAVDKSGREYHLHQIGLRSSTGWSVVYLHDHEKVIKKVVSPIFRHVGFAVIFICLVVGLFVFYLYRKASEEILQRKRLEEKLQTLSLTDELTGLYNRRGFFTLMEYKMKEVQRSETGSFMLYMDLDDLKQINDTLGHHEGDEAIRDAATILREACRETDIIARIGGDEFVVFCQKTSRENVEAIIKRFGERMSDHNQKAGRRYRLSMSVGMAEYNPGETSSVDDLMRQSEKYMYEEKRRGRVAKDEV